MKSWLLQMGVCLTSVALLLYSLVQQHNQVMTLQQRVYEKRKALKELQEEVVRNRVEFEKVAAAHHLLEVLQEKPFSHLKFPNEKEVYVIDDANP